MVYLWEQSYVTYCNIFQTVSPYKHHWAFWWQPPPHRSAAPPRAPPPPTPCLLHLPLSSRHAGPCATTTMRSTPSCATSSSTRASFSAFPRMCPQGLRGARAPMGCGGVAVPAGRHLGEVRCDVLLLYGLIFTIPTRSYLGSTLLSRLSRQWPAVAMQW